jgi:hypothetical protein
LKGRSGCFGDLGERGHLSSDQGFRLSASLDVSRLLPLSRAPYAPQGPMLMTLEPGTPVAFEAAYGWGWLAELLDYV